MEKKTNNNNNKCNSYLRRRIPIARKIRLRKQIQQYRERSTSFQCKRGRFVFLFFFLLHQPKRRIRPHAQKKRRALTHQQKIKQLLGECVETEIAEGVTCCTARKTKNKKKKKKKKKKKRRRLQLCRCRSSRCFFFLLFPSSLRLLCRRHCRLLGCAEVCGITGAAVFACALPERRQSSGSLWHPHTPHLCKSSPHPVPYCHLDRLI